MSTYNYQHYMHEADIMATKALKTIPGFSQLMRGFMKIWSEKQFKISNMSNCIRIDKDQLKKYYDMLPPICEKLGIEIPELYLKLDVNPNANTSGETSPFIVITSGLLETIPDELIPTVLAHECGHIACHHVLYSTMANILLGRASYALREFVPFGEMASIPLEMAFFYWQRSSELSADRAAVLCDGTAEKMSEVCMRLAGFDKDIQAVASKEAFMKQAHEYRDMIAGAKWDRTLEFLIHRNNTHPLMAVRALACEEWAKTEQYEKLIDGSYNSDIVLQEESTEEFDESHATKEKKAKIELTKFLKKKEGCEEKN